MPLTDPLHPILIDIQGMLSDRINVDVTTPADEAPVVIARGLETVIDHCCPNGIGWVRVSRTFPSNSFPNPVRQQPCCPPASMASDIELGVVRCTCEGMYESQADLDFDYECLENEAVQAGQDRMALLQVALCDLSSYFDCKLSVGDQVPLDTLGGCAGELLTVTIPWNACCDELV